MIPPLLRDRVLRDLDWKYFQLLELRAAREARIAAGASRFPPEEAAGRRRAFRVLARRFPGALKELDTRDIDELGAILTAVRAAREGRATGAQERWLHVVWSRHAALRLALAVRRWRRRGAVASGAGLAALGGRLEARLEGGADRNRKGRAGESPFSLNRLASSLGVEPEELIEGILHPPNGRLSAWIDGAFPLPPSPWREP